MCVPAADTSDTLFIKYDFIKIVCTNLNSKPLISTNICEYLPTVVLSDISVRSCGMHCRQPLEVTSSPGADLGRGIFTVSEYFPER